MSQPETPSAVEGDHLQEVVSRLAGALSHASAGDLAALRRLDLTCPTAPAFWRFLPVGTTATSGQARDEIERRWATVMVVIATLGPSHRPHARLGRALQEAGFAEIRLTRLLRAAGDRLSDEIVSATRYLAAKGQHVDALDLARLVLITQPEKADSVRRDIARHYFAVPTTASSIA